jgi:hypothetical protein
MEAPPNLAAGHPSSSNPRFWFFVVLAVALVVEAAPILLVWLNGGVWPLNNGEDFDFSFWPPLKAGYVPSFFCFHTGYIFWSFLKPVHALTAWTTGSPVVTLEYFQHFGYLTRVLYGLLMVGATAWFLRARRDAGSHVIAIALLLSLPLAAPTILNIYHLRIGTQLSYKLLTLVVAFASISATENLLRGDRPTRVRVYGWGFLAGVTFLEVPHYILFLLPVFFIGAGQLRRGPDFLAYVVRWALGGVGGVLLGLLLFFENDLESLLAAVLSLGRSFSVGFAQSQPGFEQFTRMIFDRRSDYFFIHVALAVHAVIIGGFVCLSAWLWRRMDARSRYVAVALPFAYALLAAAHVHVWSSRGSYTTVFSMVYGGFVILAMLLRYLLSLWLVPPAPPSRLVPPALALVALGFVIPCGLTLCSASLLKLPGHQRVAGGSFRSFNAALAGLPKPVGVVFHPDLTQFFIGQHYVPAGYLTHVGLGWHGEDGRYSRRVQAERFPDYMILHGVRVRQAGLNLQKLRLELELEEKRPPAPAATLVPMPMALGIAQAPAIQKGVHLVRYQGTPEQTDLAAFLLAEPGRGLEWEGPGARWFIAPLVDPATKQLLLDAVWPGEWPQDDRRYFFISAPSGFMVLGLKPPARSSL